jgi:hypothetical protein
LRAQRERERKGKVNAGGGGGLLAGDNLLIEGALDGVAGNFARRAAATDGKALYGGGGTIDFRQIKNEKSS